MKGLLRGILVPALAILFFGFAQAQPGQRLPLISPTIALTPIHPPPLLDVERLPVLVAAAIIFITFACVMLRRHVGPAHIRKVTGLAAVEEAVGRATEMGRPILFTPGWGGDLQRPTTLAALNILGLVAEKAAAYNCPLIFPTHDPMIMSAASETVRHAHAQVGKGETFDPDNIYYTTSSQLGYAAAVDGAITRQKPAAIMLLGTFEGEALILAETGHAVGAMQIAGTDSTIQLAFFLVACDYTLIGEELFAASGYLSGDRRILSSIRVQDLLKIAIATVLIVGAVLATLGINTLTGWLD